MPAKPPEEDESNNLGPFEEGLEKIDDSSLPPNPKEKPKGEIEIIKDVLHALEQKHNIKFEISQSGDLHTQLALNHRLDAVLHHARSQPSTEMLLALQANTMTDEHADELYEAMVHIKKYELATEEDLENLLTSIHRLLEIVIVDPQRLFEKDIQSQSRILQALQRGLAEITEWKEDKPERDLEEVNVKSSLLDEIALLKKYQSEWAEYEGEMSPQFLPIFDVGIRIMEKLIEQVGDQVYEPRGQINFIRQKIGAAFMIYPIEPIRMVIEKPALADIKIMIQDLQQ